MEADTSASSAVQGSDQGWLSSPEWPYLSVPLRLSVAGCQVEPWGTWRTLVQNSPDQRNLDRLEDVWPHLHQCRLNLHSSCENCCYSPLRLYRSDSLGQSETPCSPECSRTEWRRTSRTPLRLGWIVSSFITSELAGDTCDVLNGDNIRTGRVFLFGILQHYNSHQCITMSTTEIFEPV